MILIIIGSIPIYCYTEPRWRKKQNTFFENVLPTYYAAHYLYILCIYSHKGIYVGIYYT